MTRREPRIAILLSDLRGGGAERVNLDLAHEFARRGYVVELVVMRAEGEFLTEASASFTVVDLGVARSRSVPWALARYLRHRRPDSLLAAMWPLTSAAVVARAISGVSCQLLLVEHNTLSMQYRRWGHLHTAFLHLSLKLTYRYADAVAAVSDGAAADVARLAGLPREKVSVLNNPIPLRVASDGAARQRADELWRCPPGQRILTVGSFKKQKNHRLLLTAFSKMSNPEAKLMLLGQGDMKCELHHLAEQLNIAGRVIFAGFHDDPSPFYATADLFVLSSDYEGFGNVLVEALQHGLAVISTDCPSGPSEILQGGRWGTLVSAGDANALAQAMDAALGKSVDCKRLKQRAADFAPEKAAARYVELLFPRRLSTETASVD